MKYIKAANCIISAGAGRNLLIDFQRNRMFFVSKELTALLEQPLSDDELNGSEYRELLLELIAEDILLAVPDEDAAGFLPLPTEFDLPSLIHDAIIEVGEETDIAGLLQQLEGLQCKHLEFRFPAGAAAILLRKAETIFSGIRNSAFETVSFLVPYALYVTAGAFKEEHIRQEPRIRNIIVYSTPPDAGSVSTDPLSFTADDLSSPTCCGAIGELYFFPHLQSYLEGLQHNTCLNRKMAIDAGGNIRNCPSMQRSFGNTRDTALREAIARPGFRDLWRISKEQVSTCKDCEFRAICTDCRAYLENPDDLFSKPLKCGYDPYTCTWEEWSTHPAKQAAMRAYQLVG